MNRVALQSKQKRKWPLWLVVILSGCLLVGLSWIAFDWLAFKPIGEIAFECLGDRTAQFDTILTAICVVDANGHQRKILALMDVNLYAPSWSPDGRYLAFSDSVNLYLIDADGSNLRRVFSGNSGLGSLSWSQDGRSLLIQTTINGVSGLYLFDIEAKDLKLLVDMASGTYRSVFSFDQSKIYYPIDIRPSYSTTSEFSLKSNASKDLGFLCSGASVRPVKADNLTCSGLGQLEFYDFSENTYDSIRNWATIISGSVEPTWSPDGEFIAYVQTYWPGFMGNRNGELWIMRADGSRPTKLTNGPGDRNPAWRPEP